jgi:hypothetical protein
MATPASRRRQRSTRLTVAVALLAVSVLLVASAIAGGSFVLVAAAAVVAAVFGAAATKITHSELVQSRVDAAADRALQAQEYARITAERAKENAAFADSMTKQINDRQRLIGELEEHLAGAQLKVAETTLKFGQEARRADQAEARQASDAARLDDAEQRAAEAIVLAAELEQELTDLKAELHAWQDTVTAPKRASA